MSVSMEPQSPGQAVLGYERAVDAKKRLLGVVAALLLHALLIYGFTSGLATELVEKVQRTVNVAIVPEAKPPPPPPPPAPVEIDSDSQPKPRHRAPTKAFVPKAEVQTAKHSADTISGVTNNVKDVTPTVEKAGPVVPDAPVKKEGPPRTVARLMQGCRLPQYPKRSEDKGEEGTVVFRFLVGTDGSVQSSQLVKSSGFERLDSAAREAFMRCKFTPGTVDGAPVASWVRQPFAWRLK